MRLTDYLNSSIIMGIILVSISNIIMRCIMQVFKYILVFCIVLLSYHFTNIDSQFMVMSGNIRMERVL